MNRRSAKPVPRREGRGFFLQVTVLCALIGLVYWLGWQSPWAKADSRVVVELVDAPPPTAAPVPAPPPQQTTPVSATPSAGHAPAEDERAPTAHESDRPDPVGARHHRRKPL